MPYPTSSAYQEALQFPETAFEDEELKEAEPEANVLGLPRAITGAFAAVFPVNGRTGRWAVKCFLNEVPDQQERYRQIGRYLQKVDLPYMVDFDYQPAGIRVEGQAFPLLKMAWAEGVPLNRFVAEHLGEPDLLKKLAARWLELLARLEEAGVAHGDLQHGNVLVVRHEERLALRLVDYDTMYVPPLKGRGSAEIGHRNYQHPDRSERDFGPCLDRFAGLVIYAAMQTCIRKPDVWERCDTGENMLFRAADFYQPEAAPLLEVMAQDEALQPLAEMLRTACYLEPEDVPAMKDVLDEGAADAGKSSLIDRLKRRARQAAQNRRRAEAAAAPTGAVRYFLPAVLAGVLIAVALMMAAGWEVGVAVLAGVVLTGAAAVRHGHRRMPVVRRRRRLHQEVNYFERLIADLERQVGALQEKRKSVMDSVEELRAERLRERQEEVRYDYLKHHFVNEVQTIEGVTHRVVVRLKAAGIRTAYECTPERLAEVKRIGDRSRTRVQMWRAGLLARYDDDIPDALSPAGERRMRRHVERRVEGLEAEQERAREKIRVQSEELEQVRRRLDQVPSVSIGKYLGYLLRLTTLPARSGPQSAGEEARPAAPVMPVQEEDEGDWWEQR